jgi:hypothetical protein
MLNLRYDHDELARCQHPPLRGRALDDIGDRYARYLEPPPDAGLDGVPPAGMLWAVKTGVLR